MEFVLIDLHYSCRVIFLTPNQTFPAPATIIVSEAQLGCVIAVIYVTNNILCSIFTLFSYLRLLRHSFLDKVILNVFWQLCTVAIFCL
jgi:hypothetical protein